MLKRIHINQHELKKNRADGGKRPVITVKTYNDNNYAHNINIAGPSQLVYQPDKPLSCGAVCWIETESPIEVINNGEITLLT